MSSNTSAMDHVGELLSGYVDGELTQQQRQQVDLHCADCAQCRSERQDLVDLRQQIHGLPLSQVGPDVWREQISDIGVSATRGIGWLLLLAGVMAAGGFFIYDALFNTQMGLALKLIGAAIYLGGALLLLSVIRQRLIERKSDKYKDVEI